MSSFAGVWRLEKPIYCKKEVSGKIFRSCIGDIIVSFHFPSSPEFYSGSQDSLDKGDLIAPLGMFQEQLNWGIIHTWPEGLFAVNALVCLFLGEEAEVHKVYTNFPQWKEKFYNLMLIDIGNYIHPEEKALSLLQHGNGINDGLELFKIEKDNLLKRMLNHRYLEPKHIYMLNSEECYNVDKMTLLFTNAGSSKEISISYELLMVAYRAVLRHDFRSSIIIAATALEKSILKKIYSYYISNQLTTFEHDKGLHLALGGRFRWLKELRIDIPIQNYKSEILDIRNPTAHEGKSHNYKDTIKYLDNCKLLIQKYTPDVLDN